MDTFFCKFKEWGKHLWSHVCVNKNDKTKLQWTEHVPGANGLRVVFQ